MKIPALPALLALLALAACSADEDPSCWLDGSCEGDERCRSGDDCRSGVCRDDATCEAFCDSSTVCPAGQACVAEFRFQHCSSECGDRRTVISAGAVCQGGVVRSCADLEDPGAYCDACGCAAGLECLASTFSRCDEVGGCRCAMPQPQGGPCTDDRECESGNCSDFAGVCRVAVGAPCNTENCDRCYTYQSGLTFCSRECTDDSSCGSGACLGSRALDYFDCRPGCEHVGSAECGGGECERVAGESTLYCTCPREVCAVQEPLRPELAPCTFYRGSSGGCESGFCLGRTDCDGIYCLDWGYCSDTCAADSDCGEGGVCVDVPCAEGEAAERCGQRCLPACTGNDDCASGRDASCQQMTGVGGAPVGACTARLPSGSSCDSTLDCTSARCVSGVCG